ncbi:MAG: hypothetical protein M1832_006428 [Thelocarpon impressellum]|nr:MAG: hypothetical protein M1832_006428 [Thelocarpon impressellum]
MASITNILLLAGCASLASAQNSLLLEFTAPNSLPQCAQQCTPLYAAQGACVPPAVAPADVSSYRNCFCQSSVLASLYSTTAGLCDWACQGNDINQLRNWYLNSCGKTVVTSTSTSSSPTSRPTASVNAATTGRPSESPLATGSQNWWPSHWKWVLMLIIIFLAIVGASVGGVMLKRRKKRKAAAAAAAMATPVAWGPHQHQHFTHGHGAYNAGPLKETAAGAGVRGGAVDKGKGRMSKEPRPRPPAP